MITLKNSWGFEFFNFCGTFIKMSISKGYLEQFSWNLKLRLVLHSSTTLVVWETYKSNFEGYTGEKYVFTLSNPQMRYRSDPLNSMFLSIPSMVRKLFSNEKSKVFSLMGAIHEGYFLIKFSWSIYTMEHIL